MRKLPKWILLTGLILVLILIFALPTLSKMAKVPAGYKAKVACSEIFVAGRDSEAVLSTNFDNISPTFDWVSVKVLEDEKSVQTRFLGLGRSVAKYRDGAGCSLTGRGGLTPVSIPAPKESQSYSVDINPQVQKIAAAFFDDTALPNPIITRGLVVVQNGRIVAEQYAPGFDASTRQQSWSTAKGITQALIGIAVRDGHMALKDSRLMPEWPEGDPRADITVKDLLQMASGLEFGEDYANPNSHVDQMLFNQDNMGEYAARRKLEETPGTRSQYSSGTTNILSNILRRRLESRNVDYHAFPRRELFDKIAMSSAVFEVDAAGNFIGSSYIYATPRDFARFGQLFLQDGKWNGERLLPENWIDFTKEPAPGTKGEYGAHWSLNLGQSVLPGLPEDVIHLGGNDGQMILVIPSKNAVITRFGVTRHPANLSGDVYPLIRRLFDAL